jgi:hypothetical protein
MMQSRLAAVRQDKLRPECSPISGSLIGIGKFIFIGNGWRYRRSSRRQSQTSQNLLNRRLRINCAQHSHSSTTAGTSEAVKLEYSQHKLSPGIISRLYAQFPIGFDRVAGIYFRPAAIDDGKDVSFPARCIAQRANRSARYCRLPIPAAACRSLMNSC